MQEKPSATARAVTGGLTCGGAVFLGIAAISATLIVFQLVFQSVFAKDIDPGFRWLFNLGFSKTAVAVTIKGILAALLYGLYRAAIIPWTTRWGFLTALIGMGGLAESTIVVFALRTPSPAVFFLITFTFFLILALAVGLYTTIVSFNAYQLPGRWPVHPI